MGYVNFKYRFILSIKIKSGPSYQPFDGIDDIWEIKRQPVLIVLLMEKGHR